MCVLSNHRCSLAYQGIGQEVVQKWGAECRQQARGFSAEQDKVRRRPALQTFNGSVDPRTARIPSCCPGVPCLQAIAGHPPACCMCRASNAMDGWSMLSQGSAPSLGDQEPQEPQEHQEHQEPPRTVTCVGVLWFSAVLRRGHSAKRYLARMIRCGAYPGILLFPPRLRRNVAPFHMQPPVSK